LEAAVLTTHPRQESATAAPRSAGTWTTTGLTALAPVTWGTTYLVTTQWLPPDRPLLSGAIRALPAGLIALAITRQLPHGAWWWGRYRLGRDELLVDHAGNSTISMEDFAVALLDEVERPNHHRTRFTVAR
jgi:hypothetical protein